MNELDWFLGTYIGANLLNRPKNFASITEWLYLNTKQLRHLEDNHNLQDKDVAIISNSDDELLRLPASKFLSEAEALLKSINEKSASERSFPVTCSQAFMDSIHCNSLKARSSNQTDIQIVVHDLRTSINDYLGVGIKGKLGGDLTLLNASGENTNFIFEVTGLMNDEKMECFNNIFKAVKRKGQLCYDIATTDRMQYLHDVGCDITFVRTAKELARENLIKCGGLEMPVIVAGMLKKFYYENLSGLTSMEDCVEYLAENDVVGYGFSDLKSTYRGKISQLLLSTFTGMRLGAPWNGRQDVNGGYIVVKNNGDVVAFHSTIADEFKDFLVAKILMESPSHSRHKDMFIYKDEGKYFIKLALQLRFSLSR